MRQERKTTKDRDMWIVHDEHESIEFWCMIRPDGRREAMGVEKHSRTPMYDQDAPPDHEHCAILDAPCWHDGSSLIAEELFAPIIERGDDVDERIFRRIETFSMWTTPEDDGAFTA